MSRRILQSVIGSTGRATSPTQSGSSPTTTTAAATTKLDLGPKREFSIFHTFSSDVIYTDYTKLFFTSEKNVVISPSKVQSQRQGHVKGTVISLGDPSLNSKAKEARSTPYGGDRKRALGCVKGIKELRNVTFNIPSSVQKTRSKECLQRTIVKWTPRVTNHIPRTYAVQPTVLQSVRTLGAAKHCPYCGGLFHCTCVRTWTFEHLDDVRHKLSVPLIWITNPWPHPGVSKYLYKSVS